MGCSWDARFCVSTQAFLRNYFDLPSFYFQLSGSKKFLQLKIVKYKTEGRMFMCDNRVYILLCGGSSPFVVRKRLFCPPNVFFIMAEHASPHPHNGSSISPNMLFRATGKPVRHARKASSAWQEITLLLMKWYMSLNVRQLRETLKIRVFPTGKLFRRLRGVLAELRLDDNGTSLVYMPRSVKICVTGKYVFGSVKLNVFFILQ